MIFSNTPPDVAKAKINAWQRTKELQFFSDLEKLILKAERRGLAKSRIVRVIGEAERALSKVGGSGT
jgi:hypothetical protein